ncbi:MAG: flagellar hook protein FlgE [Bryobacteraceae bacterium]|nr:flagellar hook protein FlgE [Solibacteraceae bacterium]MCL4843865.1 flagellar hook protein FlgE [Bryobacteraceae bacterium]MCO5352914.1 flagellar hook protein FlgE [Bryobacteraceae bacterium]
MFTSFSTALSALGAHTTAVDVVGNNLANLNTPGYKSSVVAFSDLVTQSLGAGLGTTQVGFGVARPVTIRQFSQGAIQASSGPLDVAIQGDGFLVVREPVSGSQLYTRGGNLQVNKQGQLVTATGFRVQGWNEVNGVLDVTQPPTDVLVPVGSLRAPVATTRIAAELNLDASATDGPPPGTFSTSIEVFDSLGQSHVVSVRFEKTANPGEWGYTMTLPDADVATPPAPTVTGLIEFDTDGRMVSPVLTDDPPVLEVEELANGATDLTIRWDLFSGPTPLLTQYSQPSAVASNEQDGFPAAQLIRVGIGDGGRILAQYSNGQQVAVGQLAMASVRNPESMIAVGNNNYQLSARSALPAIGVPGTGGRGQILGGSVEFSTVDIAREFTNLIVLQRGYQANARVVSTVDEISQETINLKR